MSYKITNLFKIFLIFSTLIVLISSTFSERRLCGDKKCSVIISRGITNLRYSAPQEYQLSFNVNQPVRILGKSVESNLWYVEITGRRGYVPHTFIREDTVLIKKGQLIEVPVVESIDNNQNSSPNLLVSAENNKITDDTDLKSSQTINPDEVVSSTTTSPLAADEMKNQINTDKIETNTSNTELPISSPVQKNINLFDGTLIEAEHKETSGSDDDDLHIDNEDDNEYNDDESDEEIEKLNEKKKKSLKSILPSKSTEFLNIATKTADISNSDKSDIHLNKNNKNQDEKTEDQIIPLKNDEQYNVNTKPEQSLNNISEDFVESEKKTDNKSAENINDNSVENLGIKSENKTVNRSENNIEVNETIPKPFNYYKLGKEDIEKIPNNDIENIDKSKNKNIDENKTVETTYNEKNINNDISVTNSQEISENLTITETKNESNNNEKKPMENNVINNNLDEQNIEKPINNNTNQNIQSNVDEKLINQDKFSNNDEVKPVENNIINNNLNEKNIETPINNNTVQNIQSNVDEKLIDQDKVSNTDEVKPVENNIINNNLNEENIENPINNNTGKNIQSNVDEKLPDQDKLESENITFASEFKKNVEFETAKIDSSENNEEMTVNNVEKNNTIIVDNNIPSEESSENIKIADEKVLEKVSDLQENIKKSNVKEHDHSHHHHHGLPPLFNTLPNHNHDIKPKENIDNPPEQTTPSYNNLPLPDNYYDTTTIKPIEQPLKNSGERENEETSKILTVTPQIEILNELLLNSEEQSSENINENENIQDSEQQNPSNESEGLFRILLNAVNNFLTSPSFINNKKNDDNELDKILYPNKEIPSKMDNNEIKQTVKTDIVVEEGFCENIGPNSCPTTEKLIKSDSSDGNNKNTFHCTSELHFFTSMSDKILEMFDVLVYLAIAAASSILFAFGYYCICNCRKESSLISKLNIVERSLLASYKEVAIVKHDLVETRNKLSSIQDNSFGSNDMVIALKRDIEDNEETNMKLREQITNLEKELENAAEAGLELNKIVSDLLNSQNGEASIASSVEELQTQLNEQQKTIEEINTILGEKSRENSELNIFLSEQATNFQNEMQELHSKLEESEHNKILLQSKFDEAQKEINENLSQDLNSKENTIQSLKRELDLLQPKHDNLVKKLQASEARVEALEECINNTRKDSKVNIKEFMDVANLKANILAIKRERDSFKERLEGEMDARKLLDDHVKIIGEEVSTLKLEYNQSEKDKLEAQTRLDVLSTYFKEKETQLQKELSVKEAMWMKQQGETTSTVERIRTMQDEIQALKSQNDSLRAEIEAQLAAHKAQISSLENRAHETWLTSRQSERKFDEARSEAAALRRKLTALAGVPNDINRLQNSVTDGLTPISLNNAPSPIHIDSPSSPPLLGALPPPPPFLPPPPFMAPPPLPPHHFMGMPPPFMPPREMRPPPLGRLMSPPPIQSTSNHNRYSPSILDDEDDDDYEYEHHHTRGSGGGSRYTPDNGRNYSPDSRYNYTTDIMSTYDTETDFSPPPSPRGFRSGGGGSTRYNDRSTPVDSRAERNSRVGNNANSGHKAFSPQPQQNSNKSQISNNSDIRNKSKSNKGILSSGSEKSFDSRKSKGKMKM